MFQALRDKTKRIASTLAAGVLLFSQLAVVPVVSAGEQFNSNDWESWCGAYDGGTKFDTGAVGTHMGSVSGGSISVSIVDPNKTEVSNVTGSGVTITKVVIKGGNSDGTDGNGNQVYTPPFIYNLKAPLNGGGQQADISHVIVCYDRKTTVEVIKKLNPTTDSGKFNLKVKNQIYATDAGHNGTTGKVEVSDTEDVAIAETAGTNTLLSSYTTSIECRDNGGLGAIVDSGTSSGSSSRGLTIEKEKIDAGDDIVCVITNTRKTGDLQVIKNVINDNGGTKTYADFTFTTYNGDTPRTFSPTTSPDGERIVALPAGTNFAVTEVQANSNGYTTTYSSGCIGTIVEGQTKVCTITNDDNPPGLTVIKKVTNDNGGTKLPGDFTMNVSGSNVSPSAFPGSSTGTTVSLNAGSYSVSESGPDGYVAYYYGDCSGTITLGESKTCTIVNDDVPALLTVIKYVVNDNGGLLKPADFYLYVGNTQVPTGVGYYFNAGAYAVSEANQSGYEAGDWGGDCAANGSIVLNLGDQKTCTITNYDKPAKITVTKEVVNDDGGTKTASDFTLKINNTVVQSGVTKNFTGNTQYTISESGPSGYRQTDLSCYEYARNAKVWLQNPFTAELGHEYFCTIVNDDISGKLTIKKEANPQDDHDFEFESDQLGYFKLDDDGDNTNTLKNYKEFDNLSAGTYSVREQETNDWDLESIVCKNAEKYWIDWKENRLYVKVNAGDDVTCKFVNEKLNTIKGYKFEDVNMNGKWDKGEPALKDWTIKLDCDDDEDYCDATSAKTNVDGEYEFEELLPGEYTVCEVQKDGWSQTYPASNDDCYDIEIEGPGEVIEDKNFGNFKKGTVAGVKFNDANGNHQRDNNESNLKDWEITLTKLCSLQQIANCANQTWTVKTDASGSYKFSNLLPGDYKVCETQKANWVQTYPQTTDGCHLLTIAKSGQVITADFGNKSKPQVLGAATNQLANTGVSTAISLFAGLSILSVLGALHFLTRKNYAK